MELVLAKINTFKDLNDVDYFIKAAIDNNAAAMKDKLAAIGYNVTTKAEILAAMQGFEKAGEVEKFAYVLDVPYINDAPNYTGGLNNQTTTTAGGAQKLGGGGLMNWWNQFHQTASNTLSQSGQGIGGLLGGLIGGAGQGVGSSSGNVFDALTGAGGTAGLLGKDQQAALDAAAAAEKSKQRTIIIIVVVALLVLLLIGGFYFFKKKQA